LQTKRWLPDRKLVIVGDSGFAALDLLAAVRRHACLITRLRLDTNLFKATPVRKKGAARQNASERARSAETQRCSA
jgi:hypothetical protein